MPEVEVKPKKNGRPGGTIQVVKPPLGEIGVTGTSNFGGRIHSESNSKLQWERAYGTPGGIEWGEYEKMMRTDHAVASALDVLASKLRDSETQIKPADEGDPQSVLHADFIRWNLLEKIEPQWSTIIEEVIKTGVGVGFDIHEIVYDVVESELVQGGQAVVCKKLAQRLPSSIETDGWKEVNGELDHILQSGVLSTGGSEWITRVPLPANKILLFSWNRTGSNYQGYSAFRPVWFIAQIRAEFLRIIGIGGQREALGIPLATVDKDAPLSSEQLDKLQTVLENNQFHENAAIVAPKGVALSWLFSPSANKGHVIETWKQLGLAIYETVQTQQIFLGTGATGSRSVGEVHDASKNDFVNGIRAWLEATFNGVGERPYTGLIKKLIDFNFGPQKKYPKLSFLIKQNELAPAEMANAVKTLKDAGGLTLTENDENLLRSKVGLKPIDPEERARLKEEEEQKKQEQMDALQKQQGDGPGFGRPPVKMSDRVVFAPTRPLRPAEQHLMLVEMDSFMNGTKDKFEEEARGLISEMVVKALPEIKDAMADGDPSEVSAIRLDTKRLEAYVAKFLEKARLEGYRYVKEERLRQPQQLVNKRAKGNQEMVPSLALADTPQHKKAQKLLKAQQNLLTRRMVSRTLQTIESSAIDVIQRAGSPEEIVTDVVTQTIEGHNLRGDAGFVVTKTFNIGREQFAAEHGDEIVGVQYSAVLDNRVCEFCEAEDGKEFAFESDEHLEHIPPYSECLGGNLCRCLLIYLFDKTAVKEAEQRADSERIEE